MYVNLGWVWRGLRSTSARNLFCGISTEGHAQRVATGRHLRPLLTARYCRALWLVSVMLLMGLSMQAQTQEPQAPVPTPGPPKEERSTGLPTKIDWKFNFDAACRCSGL